MLDPAERRGDITRVTVDHGRDRLRVATSMRAFDNADNRIQVRIVTSHSSTFDLVHVRRGGRAVTTLSRAGRERDCEGLRVVPTSSGIVADVPRSCLAAPTAPRGRAASTFDRGYATALRRRAAHRQRPHPRSVLGRRRLTGGSTVSRW